MKNIVVLISGHGSNLQAIIELCHQQDSYKRACQKQSHQENEMRIVSVISNKEEAYGLIKAQKVGIQTWKILSRGSRDRHDYDEQLKTCIDNDAPDLIVLAGFMRILSPEFVRHYKGKIINIHPSLLPKYPGLNTHQRAMDAKDTEHGASVHFVTEQLDAGPVILQGRVTILEKDTREDVIARVQKQEHLIYPKVIQWFCQGRLMLKNNQAVLDGEILGAQGYSQAIS